MASFRRPVRFSLTPPPSDTIDTLDFGFMAELVESLTLALAELPGA